MIIGHNYDHIKGRPAKMYRMGYANKHDIRTSAEQAVVHESRGDIFRSSSENGARHDRSYTGSRF